MLGTLRLGAISTAKRWLNSFALFVYFRFWVVACTLMRVCMFAINLLGHVSSSAMDGRGICRIWIEVECGMY